MDAIEWHQRISARFSERYERSPAFRERLAVWTDLIARHVGESMRVLDAGCGPGLLACRAARRAAQVTALDGSSNMISAARAAAARESLANLEFVEGRIGDDALLADRRYDVILCSSVVEYLPDIDASLAWLAARLAPKGLLIVSAPNGGSLYRRAERLVFRLTGRPRYYAFVHHSPRVEVFAEALRRRRLEPQEFAFYGGPRLLRRLAPERICGRQETLFATVARKAAD